MKKLLILLIGCCVIWGCPAYDPSSGSIEILNYTDSAIYVYSTCSDKFPGNEDGLELFLKVNSSGNKDRCGQTIRDTIAPSYRINAYSWGGVFVGGTADNPRVVCGTNIMTLYFIKEITIRTKTWKEICEKQLYEKKNILTQEQLEKVCWRVTYD